MKKNGLITTGFHIPYNPKLKARARELRKNMTPAESKLWYNFLKDFPYTVLRQKPLGNYIADFYCPKLKLVIEIDGATHAMPENIKYDWIRTQVLEGYGLRELRFSNDDVMNNFKNVCREILKSPQPTGSPPLLKEGLTE